MTFAKLSAAKLTCAIGALVLAGSCVVAQAADMPTSYEPVAPMPVPSLSGFYLGSTTTLNFLDNTNFALAGPTTIDTDYDVGFYSGLRLGYNFGPMSFVSPRIEIEGGYGSSSVDTHTVGGVGVAGIDSFGDARSWQGYVNGYLDLAFGSFTGITPFIGGGVGFASVELRKQGISAVGVVMDDTDTGFAYHLDAGVSLHLDQLGLGVSLLQGTTVELGYRYTNVSDLTFTARDGTQADTDYTSNAATLGFRKQF